MYVDYYLPVTSVTLYILLKPKVDSLCTDPPSPPIFIERRGSVHRLKIDLSISEKFHKNFPRIIREINVEETAKRYFS